MRIISLPSADKMYRAPPERDSASASPLILSRFSTPVGELLAGTTEQGVCLLEFADHDAIEAQARLRKWFGQPAVHGTNQHIELLQQELDSYFAGTLKTFTIALVLPGTEFQVAAWNQLRQIPYGETISYEQQARAMGRPKAQRAVGSANGVNRLAIVIPCHRVVRQNGALGGYGGGLWRKKFLLDLEKEHRGAGPS